MDIKAVETTTREALVKSALSRAVTYEEYHMLMGYLAREGKSTSPRPNDALAAFTRLNHARMRRLDKMMIATKIPTHNPLRQSWLIITESWCGDAAQVIPVVNRIAKATPGVDLKFVLRDREEELMDAFLTNGARSIPLVIFYDHDLGKVLGTWGSRPSTLTKMVELEKARSGKLSDAFKKEIQIWYNKDKGKTIISDFNNLLGTFD